MWTVQTLLNFVSDKVLIIWALLNILQMFFFKLFRSLVKIIFFPVRSIKPQMLIPGKKYFELSTWDWITKDGLWFIIMHRSEDIQ